MAHKHSVYDSDTHFSINPITRALKNEASGKTSLVQYDHNSERFTFEIPRYIEGHDMSLCNVIRVHYINIDAKTKTEVSGIYEVEDMQISPEGDDVVICSWLVSRNSTQLVGSLNFLIRFACVTDGVVDYAWNTATYTGIFVSSGINADETFEDDYVDVIEQWKESVLKEFEAEAQQQLQITADQITQEVNNYVDGKFKGQAGIIYPLATAKVPKGFLLCDGAEYSRAEYAELFDAIGTIYGEGNGQTTFNVPNLATRVPVGAGNAYELGDTGGEAEHTLTKEEMPKHEHGVVIGVHGYEDWDEGIIAKHSVSIKYGTEHYTNFPRTDTVSYVSANANTAATGGDQPHNNMQPYTVVNYIISTGKEVEFVVGGNGGVGRETAEGGVILTDCENQHKAAEGAVASGLPIPRNGANVTYDEDGEQVPQNESDWRYNEAYGKGSEASGRGAVAFARASKSLGYRTQTGYPPSAEHAAARPEAIVQMDENGIPTYPHDSVGQGAVAIGADTAALGNHSVAGGCGAIAKGESALAFGSNVKADGDYSTAIGVGCVADGVKSFAGGAVSKAMAAHAFAFGYHNTASGEKAVAMGHQVEASGTNSVAFGSDTKAVATSSIAAGHTSEARTKYAAAMGYNVKTSDDANAIGQMVVGRFNSTDDIEKAMLVVGTGNGDGSRRNALVVNRDGSAKVLGELSAGSIAPKTAASMVRASRIDANGKEDGDFVGQLCIEYDPDTEVNVYMWLGVYGWVRIAHSE